MNYDQILLDSRRVDPTAPYPILHQALRLALNEEQNGRLFCGQIVQMFGQRAPFADIYLAKNEHIILLSRLCEQYGVPKPLENANIYVQTPSWLSNCQICYQGELQTAALYDYLIPLIAEADVRQAFTRLADKSRNRNALACAQAIQAAALQEQYHTQSGISPQQAYVQHGAIGNFLEKVLAGMNQSNPFLGLAAPMLRKLPPAVLGGAALGASLVTIIKKYSKGDIS